MSLSKTPNFLFIGADRCGSKWLHNIIRHHPDCYVPTIADPYYFDKNYSRGQQWYSSMFASAPASALAIGELSHDYIHSKEAAQRIAMDLPNVKIFATLRHPVEKTYSAWASAYEVGAEKRSFAEAVKCVDSDYLARSMYADSLEWYFERFEPDQIGVFLYDNLIDDPEGFARDIFSFLGVPFVQGLDYTRVFNPLRKSRGGFAGVVARTISNVLRKVGMVEFLGTMKHARLIRSIFFGSVIDPKSAQINPELRKELIEYFEPQIARLENRLRVDLSQWRV